MSGVGEVLDREHRLEHRLQSLGRTAALRRVHQQKLVVRSLLDLDQVRHLADFPDVPENLANALAASECLRHVAPLKLACPLISTPTRQDAQRIARQVFPERRRTPLPLHSSRRAASNGTDRGPTTLTPGNPYENAGTAP